jgi:quercetin dioxygenase-like cupin family protein
MDTKDLRDLVHFTQEGPHHGTVFESTHLWSEVVCLDRAQELGPIADPDSDGLVVLLAGQVAVQVGRGRRRMSQWGSVLVPAGAELTLRNASVEPAVVLLVAAPPPTARPLSE